MNDISNKDEPLDPELLRIFQDQHRDLAPEPFIAATRRRVRKERQRTWLVKRSLLSAAVVLVIIASPWLIAASNRMSQMLDASFELVSNWLGTPLGALGALIAAGLAAYAYRRRRWR